MTYQSDDRLVRIFQRQSELMRVYEGIEAANGLLETGDVPVDLDNRFGQARLKNFAWRFTEELGEAATSLDLLGSYHAQTREEVVDALHFLIELNLLAGIPPAGLIRGCCIRRFGRFEGDVAMDDTFGDLLDMWFYATGGQRQLLRHITHENQRQQMMTTIQSLAAAMHCLKHRPWKKERLPTNVDKFNGALVDTFFHFGGLLQLMGMTTLDVYNGYMAKSNVNKLRQSSNY